ncbi:DUF924 family protein [Actibacterium sp.]|uniref:DUF924 family protein n=1 Tax=Actibacterium sp. TaxID=1872125 RepID=UPI003563B0DF
MQTPEDVIRFWLDEVGPTGWYAGGEELDAKVRDRFGDLWAEAHAGGLHKWLTDPRGTLAYLLVTDQFPRNMFRNDPRAFATDGMARAAAKHAIAMEFDLRIPEPAREFFYMPLMHSEMISDQDRCVRLIMISMRESGPDKLLHARAHREVIRHYGRFPHRNAALSRENSAEEEKYLSEGGYMRFVEQLRAA